jgi:glucose/arabinose dehydrogenase
MSLVAPRRSRTRRIIASAFAAVLFVALCVALLAAFGGQSPSTNGDLVGTDPPLPQPDMSLVPTINFSQAEPWPTGKQPAAPAGFKVTRYASGLDHPRWLYVLPNGDVLVAEASTVAREPKSISENVQAWLQRNSGAIKASANRITLLRGSNGSGEAEQKFVFATGLRQPFGMLLLGDKFYVANTDGVWLYSYHDGDTHLEAGRKVIDLPAGGYNNHWTRNIIANRDGTKLYVTVGSGSNVGENGIDNEFHRANILEANPDGSGLRVFASGIRNPNGLAWAPGSDVLWTVANERDMLGNDLVPDFLTSVKDGAFYGWPYSYWGKNIDERAQPRQPALVEKAIAPDYALGAHVAALGLAFYMSDAFPEHFRGGVFIGEHGSWNRRPFTGYKVVYIAFCDGLPCGKPEDFLTGFMPTDRQGIAYGRPVGVAVDARGALLVADDVGNTVWRVAADPSR